MNATKASQRVLFIGYSRSGLLYATSTTRGCGCSGRSFLFSFATFVVREGLPKVVKQESAMDRETRRKFYLEKARDAEEKAEKVQDIESRATWLQLARDYRSLAKTT